MRTRISARLDPEANIIDLDLEVDGGSQMNRPGSSKDGINNSMRFGIDYRDPGADYYEAAYRERVVKQLHRRAATFGFRLETIPGVS